MVFYTKYELLNLKLLQVELGSPSENRKLIAPLN